MDNENANTTFKNRSKSIKNISLALQKFQKEMPNVPMNKSNPFFGNSKYADFADVVEISKPHMFANNLSITQLPFSGFEGGKLVVGTETILMHSESGEWLSCVVYYPIDTEPAKDGKKAANIPQKGGVSITYTKRQGWTAILGIASEEDTDGNTDSQQVSSTQEDSNVSFFRNNLNKMFRENPDKQEQYKKLYEKYGHPDKLTSLETIGELQTAMKEVK